MWVLREGWRSENSQTSRLRARVHTTVFVGWENTVISAHRTKLQDTEGEKRETGRFTRETRGERARAKQKQKESVRKSAAYPNSIQLQNFVSTLSFDYLLISTGGGGAERTSDTGRESGKWHPGCAFASRRRTVRSSACPGPTPATSSWALLLLPAQLSAQRRPLGGAVASLEPVCVRVRVPSACRANRWSFARKWSPVFICAL